MGFEEIVEAALADELMLGPLLDSVIEAFDQKVRIDTDLNERDGSYAAGLVLICAGGDDCPSRDRHDGCTLLRSAYIFDTEREALEVAMEMKATRREELRASLT